MYKPHPHQVRTWKMHLYTIIQVLVIALLFGLKLSEGSMVYPLVIVLLIPLKFVLGKFVFTKQEMEAVSPRVVCRYNIIEILSIVSSLCSHITNILEEISIMYIRTIMYNIIWMLIFHLTSIRKVTVPSLPPARW